MARKMLALMLFVALAALSFAQAAAEPAQGGSFISTWFSADLLSNWVGQSTFQILAGSVGMCAPKASDTVLYTDLIVVSITAISVSVLLSLILFLLGRALAMGSSGAPPSSYLSLKVSDAIVSIIVMLIIWAAYTGTGGANYIPLLRGMEYVSKVMSLTINSYFIMMVLNWMMHFIMGISFPLDVMSQLGATVVSIGLDKILGPVSTLLTILSNFSNLVIGEFMTKLGLLCFVRSSMFMVLLPLGFFLRGFGITKGAGNAIIAISIALHFFYPIMLTMNYAIFNADMALTGDSLATKVTGSAVMFIKLMSVPLAISAATSIGGKIASPVAGTAIPGLKIPAAVKGWFGSSRAFLGFSNLMSVMSKWSSLYVLAYVTFMAMMMIEGTYGIIFFLAKIIALYGLILTAIDIFATLMFARELSGILGTQIELSAFMKIL